MINGVHCAHLFFPCFSAQVISSITYPNLLETGLVVVVVLCSYVVYLYCFS
jgi:general stress protein CsbA